MAKYILIHGSLSGGWCWTKVKSIIENNGHEVIAPDLPGHATGSQIAPSEVNMDRYVSFVKSLIESDGQKVILIGHSLGGAVITKVIDEIPDNIVERAHFVSALIPKDGDIIGKMLKEDSGSELYKAFKINSENKTVEFEWNAAREIYYNGCSDEDFEFAKKMVVPQSIIPFSTPIEIKNKKGIKRIGIVSAYDKSLSPDYQRCMYENAGCEIKSIASGHASFFSKPVELAEILLGEEKESFASIFS